MNVSSMGANVNRIVVVVAILSSPLALEGAAAPSLLAKVTISESKNGVGEYVVGAAVGNEGMGMLWAANHARHSGAKGSSLEKRREHFLGMSSRVREGIVGEGVVRAEVEMTIVSSVEPAVAVVSFDVLVFPPLPWPPRRRTT